jgi:hypothetical protein
MGSSSQGLEFTVEGDTTDAIDAGDASAPNKVEHEFRVADESEGLSDHNATSASVRQSHTASSMNVLSANKRDRAAAACLHLPIFCFFTPFGAASPRAAVQGRGLSAALAKDAVERAKRPNAPSGSRLSTLTRNAKGIGDGSAAQAGRGGSCHS